MPNENTREVYRALQEMQKKYTYFLLAASLAAIAFSINKTQNSVISVTQIPLAISVLCWAWSFFCGCRLIGGMTSNIYSNLLLLNVANGDDEMVAKHPMMANKIIDFIKESIDARSSRLEFYANTQFWFLISGGVFYIAWHTIEMYLRGLS